MQRHGTRPHVAGLVLPILTTRQMSDILLDMLTASGRSIETVAVEARFVDPS
jgi:hypothetical protein